MTNDQIDTAIAEFRGWTEVQHYPQSNRVWGYLPNSDGFSYRLSAVPQFHKCLNAMAEVEDGISASLEQDYFESLHEIAGSLGFYKATAAQRAEALLRTIGKWQGSPA